MVYAVAAGLGCCGFAEKRGWVVGPGWVGVELGLCALWGAWRGGVSVVLACNGSAGVLLVRAVCAGGVGG